MKIESGWAADIRRTRNIGNFKQWKVSKFYRNALERLLLDLKADKNLSNPKKI